MIIRQLAPVSTQMSVLIQVILAPPIAVAATLSAMEVAAAGVEVAAGGKVPAVALPEAEQAPAPARGQV